MSTVNLRAIVAVVGVGLLGLVGCAASSGDLNNGTGRDGGVSGSAGTGGPATGAAGSSTMGAAGAPQDGGSSDSGSFDGSVDVPPTGAAGVTGAAGTGVGAAGAGAGGTTGAAGSGMPGCEVQLYRVLPTVLGSPAPGAEVSLSSVTGLESGSILRVKARADGLAGDLQWDWTVEVEGAVSGKDEVVVTPLDDSHAVMDISLAKPGVYNITVRVTGASPCRAAFQHPAVREPSAPSFTFRVTPPAGSRLPTREIPALSADASRAVRTLDLGMGGAAQVLTVLPVDGRGQPLPSFVRVSGPSFAFDLEGYTGSAPLVATLESSLAYEMLIIPEVGLAPMLVRGSGSPAFFNNHMMIVPGTAVVGDARDGEGRPVAGARILLREDTGRPSTIGVSGADGAFSLQTREGILSATVVSPPGSGLPEARVATSEGLVLAKGVKELQLSMTWAASNKSAPLEVVVRDKGVVVEGARVRVDMVGELPAAGQVRVKANDVVGAMAMVYPAKGTARAEGVTDAQGSARLGLLPIAKYRVTVAPPPGSTAAITSADVDLQGPGPVVPLAFASLVKVTGTLLPASDGAGVRVTALDAGVLAPTSPAITTADASGKYELLLSPGRTYELIAEPPGGQRWQRVAMARVTAGASAQSWSHELPPGLSWSGIVTGGGRRVAGAIVQVFCVAPPASCVDATIPLAEGVSHADGTLSLTLPNFAP